MMRRLSANPVSAETNTIIAQLALSSHHALQGSNALAVVFQDGAAKSPAVAQHVENRTTKPSSLL